MNNFFDFISEWISNNPGKAVGAFLGFVAGILILTLGLINTLLIVLLIFIGFLIGKLRDEDVSIIDKIKRIFKRDR